MVTYPLLDNKMWLLVENWMQIKQIILIKPFEGKNVNVSLLIYGKSLTPLNRSFIDFYPANVHSANNYKNILIINLFFISYTDYRWKKVKLNAGIDFQRKCNWYQWRNWCTYYHNQSTKFIKNEKNKTKLTLEQNDQTKYSHKRGK